MTHLFQSFYSALQTHHNAVISVLMGGFIIILVLVLKWITEAYSEWKREWKEYRKIKKWEYESKWHRKG